MDRDVKSGSTSADDNQIVDHGFIIVSFAARRKPTRFSVLKKDTKSLIDALSSGPVRQYLTDHEHADLRAIILNNKEILGIPTAELFGQIAVRKKAREKLPLYYRTPGIIYPPQLNFEQSSSETTALFKREILEELFPDNPVTVVDLTGGFGVDTYFLSTRATHLHYVEPDESLLEIARFNHRLLKATNITYHPVTAEAFLGRAAESFDVIYVDPSRRLEGNRRVIGFEDAQPDVVSMAPGVFEKSRWLLVKASPLLDLQAGISQLPFVRTVYVLSVKNECRELLFLCEKGYAGEVTLEAINMHADGGREMFRFHREEERAATVAFGEPDQYLYEPNASILKAGAFKLIALRHNLIKLHANTHLYTSPHAIDDFPGRSFRVEAWVKPDPSAIRKHFPDGHANVTTRNYPLTAEQLRKKAKLKDGGTKFLIGFSGIGKRYLAVANRL